MGTLGFEPRTLPSLPRTSLKPYFEEVAREISWIYATTAPSPLFPYFYISFSLFIINTLFLNLIKYKISLNINILFLFIYLLNLKYINIIKLNLLFIYIEIF